MPSNPTTFWATWAMPATFPFPAFAPFGDAKVMETWQKFMGLNTDFTKSMTEEAQFDWASFFVPQDPEELYARQWNNQMPLLSIPLHYASAMMELGAATQRAWMDAWGHMLGMPALATAATDAAADAVVDVPAAQVRETPRPRKPAAH
ncbi:polyhydroxyalkanoate granule-associated phasin [Cupriavidus pauculus]|nr:polyhydroxyalkanoate granule-associated phasin [Cupriavidus pauculus]